MEDSSLLRLQIDVAESLAGQVTLGNKLRVEISGAGAELEGKVSEIAPSADVGSRTFSIKLDLPAHESLRAGQFGRAFLPRGEREAIHVPASALVSRGQMDYVFVVDEEQVARLRIVRVAQRDGERIEVLAGLDGGETVVQSPPAELRDGQPVNTTAKQG
jgi:RND family efflux transporter MFP subunit